MHIKCYLNVFKLMFVNKVFWQTNFLLFSGVMELNRCKFFINLTKEGEAVIRSPGFPFSYVQGLNCTWEIDAGTSKYVKLEIVYLNLAKSTTELKLKEVIII